MNSPLEPSGRSIKASSVLSAENDGSSSSADQPRRTASIGPLSVASHSPRHSPFLTAFRYSHTRTARLRQAFRTVATHAQRRFWGSAFLSQVCSLRRVICRAFAPIGPACRSHDLPHQPFSLTFRHRLDAFCCDSPMPAIRSWFTCGFRALTPVEDPSMRTLARTILP